MSLSAKARFVLQRDVVLPTAMALAGRRRRRPGAARPHFGPPLESRRELGRVMTRHYALARYAEGAMPVAWVTSGAPVELLRAFGYYTVYPENHGAVCGARHLGASIAGEAEGAGYSQDLCAYARIDLGHALSGRTPAGRLPKPDLLFCTTNICQTVLYWFKELAWRHRVPLVVLDAPFVYGEPRPSALAYLEGQIRDTVPLLESLTGRDFREDAFGAVLASSQRASRLWGEVLGTLRHRPAPMTLFDAFVHLAPVVSLRGLPVCERYYERLLGELNERCERGVGALTEERHRLLWDNIAIWFALKPLSALFAEHGCALVAGTYTNAWAETADHLDPRDPFGSLARAYGLIFLNRDLGYRLALMERLAREYSADGLVIHSARSCKPYSLGQYDLRSHLGRRLGIRSVVLEADMADERAYAEEPAKTRLMAFFESLEVA
jgi:benzoyl-CoA reductase/2-hydroxyglutaryl-CoA dehydratase subunit BcrC/BadD/HgdB